MSDDLRGHCSEQPPTGTPDPDEQFEYKGIRLTKSKTKIIEIPALVAGQMIDQKLDCYCAACIKWAAYRSSASISQGEELKHSSETSTETPVAERMTQIYRCFGSLRPRKKVIERLGCFVPKCKRKRGLTKKVVKKR